MATVGFAVGVSLPLGNASASTGGVADTQAVDASVGPITSTASGAGLGALLQPLLDIFDGTTIIAAEASAGGVATTPSQPTGTDSGGFGPANLAGVLDIGVATANTERTVDALFAESEIAGVDASLFGVPVLGTGVISSAAGVPVVGPSSATATVADLTGGVVVGSERGSRVGWHRGDDHR